MRVVACVLLRIACVFRAALRVCSAQEALLAEGWPADAVSDAVEEVRSSRPIGLRGS